MFTRISIIAFLLLLGACSEQEQGGQAAAPEAPAAAAAQEAQQEAAQAEGQAAAQEGAAGSRPNVLLIFADDMGFGDIGYNGSEIATPNLDELAAAGVRLDRNYVYPVCSPTRVALLTGHSPFPYGVDGPMANTEGLPLHLKMMPEYFKELGYQTSLIGKWHLGLHDTDYWPISRGFDYHYGFLGGWIDFYTHGYMGGLDWQRNGASVTEEGHATDLLTQDAIRLIRERQADQPFFMFLSYNAPHNPLQYTPANSGLNEDVEPGDRFVYAEMMTQLDASIGEVVDVLEAEAILDNTLIIFSSDNGGSLANGASNGELAGGKGNSFEGGLRVPGWIWWPGHVEGGRIMEQQIAVHDWLPTIMEAVGAGADILDSPYGQSMWAAIARDEQVPRQATTIGRGGNIAAFDWPYKLLRSADQEGNEIISLYNVVEDPVEASDIAASHPELVERLVAVLDALPQAESIANPPDAPRPESFFWNEDRTGWDYEVRVPETLPPWAEAAERGQKWGAE